jgi:hypothetical protein
MNVKAPKVPFTDRFVVCGDSGSSRLFKDGIGAAYLMGKSVAETAVFHGVGKRDFREHYLPVYKSIINDNRFGSAIFTVTELFKLSRWQTRTMLDIVRREQNNSNSKHLSTVLWDMFTGSERYKNIFIRCLNPVLTWKLVAGMVRNIIPSKRRG